MKQAKNWSGLGRAARLAAFSFLAALSAMGGVAAPPLSAAEVPVAQDARVAGDAKRTRFVADLTAAVPVRAFTLADPYRVIIDMPEVRFDVPPERGEEGRGLVSAFRYGLFAPGKSRVVLDAVSPVIVDRAFVLPPQDGQPARLVVDLLSTDENTFRQRLAMASAGPRWGKPAEAEKAPPIEVEQAVGPREGVRPLVVIDPGHGGIDGGAVGPSGTLEKDIVLAFSRKLKEALEKEGRYDVLLTRDQDIYVPLGERMRMAREKRAALFVSVHADSFSEDDVHGATIYTLSERASDAEAAALAAKENRSDIVAGLDLPEDSDAVASILVDLVRRETKNLSVLAAKYMVEELGEAVRLNKNPHRFAGFKVLKAPDVPSVLLELGYLSNGEDERKLTSPEWHEKVANAVAAAKHRFLSPQFAERLR
jgi:N-acetylmuramoyl-L-alanine amidase